MVDEYLFKKEEESRRSTPAADFQQQIKYDILAYPKLVQEKHYATWRRQFKAIAVAHEVKNLPLKPKALLHGYSCRVPPTSC